MSGAATTVVPEYQHGQVYSRDQADSVPTRLHRSNSDKSTSSQSTTLPQTAQHSPVLQNTQEAANSQLARDSSQTRRKSQSSQALHSPRATHSIDDNRIKVGLRNSDNRDGPGHRRMHSAGDLVGENFGFHSPTSTDMSLGINGLPSMPNVSGLGNMSPINSPNPGNTSGFHIGGDLNAMNSVGPVDDMTDLHGFSALNGNGLNIMDYSSMNVNVADLSNLNNINNSNNMNSMNSMSPVSGLNNAENFNGLNISNMMGDMNSINNLSNLETLNNMNSLHSMNSMSHLNNMNSMNNLSYNSDLSGSMNPSSGAPMSHISHINQLNGVNNLTAGGMDQLNIGRLEHLDSLDGLSDLNSNNAAFSDFGPMNTFNDYGSLNNLASYDDLAGTPDTDTMVTTPMEAADSSTQGYVAPKASSGLSTGIPVKTKTSSASDQPFVVDLAMVKETMAAVNKQLGVDLGDVEVEESALCPPPSPEDSGSSPSSNSESPAESHTKRRDNSSNSGGSAKNEMSHMRLICDACGHIVTAVGMAVLRAITDSKEEAERLGTGSKSLPSLRKKRGGILGFKELAARAKLSPWHFHRVFRSVTGVTPKAYGEALWDYLMRKHGYASDSAGDSLPSTNSSNKIKNGETSNNSASQSSSGHDSGDSMGDSANSETHRGMNNSAQDTQISSSSNNDSNNGEKRLNSLEGGAAPRSVSNSSSSNPPSGVSIALPPSGSQSLPRVASSSGVSYAASGARNGIRKARSLSRSGRSRSRNRSQTQAQVLTSLTNASAGTQAPMPVSIPGPVLSQVSTTQMPDSKVQYSDRRPRQGFRTQAGDSWISSAEFTNDSINSELLNSGHLINGNTPQSSEFPDVSGLSLQMSNFAAAYPGLTPLTMNSSNTTTPSSASPQTLSPVQQSMLTPSITSSQSFSGRHSEQYGTDTSIVKTEANPLAPPSTRLSRPGSSQHGRSRSLHQSPQFQQANQFYPQFQHFQASQSGPQRPSHGQEQHQLRIQHRLQQPANQTPHSQQYAGTPKQNQVHHWENMTLAVFNGNLQAGDPTLTSPYTTSEYTDNTINGFKDMKMENGASGSATPNSAGPGEADDLGSLPQTFYMSEKEKLEYETNIYGTESVGDDFLNLLGNDQPLSKRSYSPF